MQQTIGSAVTVSRQSSKLVDLAVQQTESGWQRGHQVGDLLCERTNPRDPEDKYTVWPYQGNPLALIKKGLRVLAIGMRTRDGSWRPLFEQAKANHQDRADEFQAEIDKCDANANLRRAMAGQHVPTAEEKRMAAQSTMIAEGVMRGVVSALQSQGNAAQDPEVLAEAIAKAMAKANLYGETDETPEDEPKARRKG